MVMKEQFSEAQKTAMIETLRRNNQEINDYLQREFFNNSRYSEPKRLHKYEYQVYSQSGEDGIIAEIFNRIKLSNKYFVEFGVGNGIENNSVFLLTQGWKGLWIEKDPEHVTVIRNDYKKYFESSNLKLSENFITAENIESLFEANNVPAEFDLLSVDIDGNDYWVWKSIIKYSPRVVVIEYNPFFLPPKEWVMPYKADYVWDSSINFSASLKSFELLGYEKGYKLVGCNFSGVNAFFIREDLVNDKFCEPFTAENHYEKARYDFVNLLTRKRHFGKFVADVLNKG